MFDNERSQGDDRADRESEEPSGNNPEIVLPETGEVRVIPRDLPKRAPTERTIHPRRPLPNVPEAPDGDEASSGSRDEELA
jgi:hypothetical protein